MRTRATATEIGMEASRKARARTVYNLTTPLQGTPQELYLHHQDAWPSMFIDTLHVGRKWNQQMMKLWYSYTMGYFSAITKNEIVLTE